MNWSFFRPKPGFTTKLKKGQYTAEVTVGNEEPVEGSFYEFCTEAEGSAAKSWLAKHQPNWKQVLDSKPTSSAFSEGEEDEVEMPYRSGAQQEEEDDEVKLTPPSSPHSEPKESSSKVKKEVSSTEKARVKSGGLAALDSMSKNEAFNGSDASSGEHSLALNMIKTNQEAEWLSKGKSGRDGKAKNGSKEKTVKRKVKVKEDGGSRKIREMLENAVESQKRESKDEASKVLKKGVFGSLSSADEVEEEQSTRGEKRKKAPSEEKFSKESFHRNSSDEKQFSEKTRDVKWKGEEKAESEDTIGGKISPVKSIGKSRKMFNKFDSAQSGKEESSKSSFSFSSKPLRESSKCNANHGKGSDGDCNGSEEKVLKREKKDDVKVKESKEKGAFKFSDAEKKLKEDEVKRAAKKKETKLRSPAKKVKKEKSSPPNKEAESASGSSVFDHEDDPEVMEIVAKQRQEACALSR